MAKQRTFDQALTTFKSSAKTIMSAARDCAELALIHYHEHGDLTYCQRFLEAMENNAKNFVRRTAYLAWLVEYAPVKMEKGVLLKDKSRADNFAWNLDKAKATPFWDFAPEKQIMDYSAETVVQALIKTIGKFRNTKSYQATNSQAVDFLDNAEEAIKALVDTEPSVSHEQTPVAQAA